MNENITKLDKEIEKLAKMPIDDRVATSLSVYGTARAELVRIYGENEVSETVENSTEDIVKEYKDILPRYEYYKNAKIRYQTGEITEQALVVSVNDMCREIYEFCEILYTNADAESEKRQYLSLFQSLADISAKKS